MRDKRTVTIQIRREVYLNEHKKNLSLPLISRVGAVKDSMLSHDIKATDLYTLGIQSHAFNQPIGRDYRQPPIR